MNMSKKRKKNREQLRYQRKIKQNPETHNSAIDRTETDTDTDTDTDKEKEKVCEDPCTHVHKGLVEEDPALESQHTNPVNISQNKLGSENENMDKNNHQTRNKAQTEDRCDRAHSAQSITMQSDELHATRTTCTSNEMSSEDALLEEHYIFRLNKVCQVVLSSTNESLGFLC